MTQTKDVLMTATTAKTMTFAELVKAMNRLEEDRNKKPVKKQEAKSK